MIVNNETSMISKESTSKELIFKERNPDELLDCEVESLVDAIETETKVLCNALNDKIEKKIIFLKHLEKRLEFVK